jgi:Flp pilus assembly protein TadG
MMRSARPDRRSSGQGLVEFALVIPILILIILSIVDMGRAVFAFNTVSEAAKTAARVAIVNQDLTAIQSAVINDSRITWLGLKATNVPAPSYGCTAPYSIGCVVTTTVTYQFQAITPVVSTIIGSINMSSTSALPIERVSP